MNLEVNAEVLHIVESVLQAVEGTVLGAKGECVIRGTQTPRILPNNMQLPSTHNKKLKI